MITFITQSGSVYNVDTHNKQIRRAYTTEESGESRRVSGDWRDYRVVSDIQVGESVIIVWGNEVELLDGSEQWATPTTFTSPVASVSESDSDTLN